MSLLDNSVRGMVLYKVLRTSLSLYVQVPFLYNFILLLYQIQNHVSRTIFENP
jgi:hypothetical protein